MMDERKVQFARGIGQREMLRANTLPSITRAKIGCLARLRVHEENARFVLLALFLVVYLCLGAALFHHIERPHELAQRSEIASRRALLKQRICGGLAEGEGGEEDDDDDDGGGGDDVLLSVQICRQALKEFVKASGGVTDDDEPRDRFDLAGAFFFSATTISTIGFGTSTPRTSLGRVLTICYGALGCTCCVLFFNLFLERLITGLSHVLRCWHEHKLRRRLQMKSSAQNAASSAPVTLLVTKPDYAGSSSSSWNGDETSDNWRPSVYKVFCVLLLLCSSLIAISATIYSSFEGWSFVQSAYYSFTSFATIGFGDLVSNQQPTSARKLPGAYRLLNFGLLTLGACCFYSFFNVSSIVIRQALNFVIKKMDIKLEDGELPFCCCRGRGGRASSRPQRYLGLGLRPPPGWESERSSIDCSAAAGNPLGSGDGLLTLREFLMSNQTSVVMFQRQLIGSSRSRPADEEGIELGEGKREGEKISADRVGPLAILDETFGADL